SACSVPFPCVTPGSRLVLDRRPLRHDRRDVLLDHRAVRRMVPVDQVVLPPGEVRDEAEVVGAGVHARVRAHAVLADLVDDAGQLAQLRRDLFLLAGGRALGPLEQHHVPETAHGGTLPPPAPDRTLPRGPCPVGRRRPRPAGPGQTPPSSAAMIAPSSQQASRSALDGSPVTTTGGWTAFHFSPVVIDSRARSAPLASLSPCRKAPNGRRTVSSRHG